MRHGHRVRRGVRLDGCAAEGDVAVAGFQRDFGTFAGAVFAGEMGIAGFGFGLLEA